MLQVRLSTTRPAPQTEVSAFTGMFKHCLVLIWLPSPHDAEHSPKSDHKLHRGQSCLTIDKIIDEFRSEIVRLF